MPSASSKQQRFFQAVKGAKHNPSAPAHLRKVANSMSEKDIDDFSNHLAELKIKKATLSVLKDIQEPMYLNEDEGYQDSADVVANTFHVNSDWTTYIKPYIGQPLSEKELEALENFKEKQPTTIARTEIWYKTTDSFGASHTTVIKKMKDSGQFSFTAFQKQESLVDDKEKSNEPEEMNAGNSQDPSQEENPQGAEEFTEKEETPKKDDIIVTKSILFKDDIKGASILLDFLKKLDL